MGNRHRGDVDLRVGDRIVTLRFSTSALVRLEEHFSDGINGVARRLSDVENVKLGDWVHVVWAAMLRHQPTATLSDAEDLIDEVGVQAAIEHIGLAMQAAFPDAKGGDRPSPEATGGTGPASSSATSH